MTYVIRSRKRVEASPKRGMKACWVEWQVWQGRRIVARYDTEGQAQQWVARQPNQ